MNEITFRHPATQDQLEQVWNNLRDRSRHEAEALGLNLDSFKKIYADVTCALLDGVPAAVFGARVRLDVIHFIFFATDLADSHPSLWRRTTKMARWYVKDIMQRFPGRRGVTADTEENEAAIRWNALVGFHPSGKYFDLRNGVRLVQMERPPEPDPLTILARAKPAFLPQRIDPGS